MKLVGTVILALLALALLRAAVTALIVLLLLWLLACLILAPTRTLSIAASFVLLGAFSAYPVLGLTLMIAVIVAGTLAKK